ncbi:MAG: hypothetical protein NXH85_05515 [Pseudomonadaceae bacterium]|nr:hypothetical protein [Pseudomonadaceae bacterium]
MVSLQPGYLPAQYNPYAAAQQAPAAAANSGHSTSNPTSSLAPAPVAGQSTIQPVGQVGFASAVPAAFIAFVPSFGVPIASVGGGYGAAGFGSGQVASGVPQAQAGAAESGHVTKNPTSALGSDAAPTGPVGGDYAGGFAGSVGAFGGIGAYALATPVVVVPVFLQLGSPIFLQQPVQPGVAPAPDGVPSNPVADDAPVVDDGADPAPATPPSGTPPVVDPGTETDNDDVDQVNDFPISRYTAEDFARLRGRVGERSVESNLSLSLTTKDGDTIKLDFAALDVSSGYRLRGELVDGGSVRESSRSSSSERALSIEITGDLSDDEKAAIDALLDGLVEAAGSFLSGDGRGALRQLEALDFDTSQLAEFSLDLSVTKKVSVDRLFKGEASPLSSIAARDSNVSATLDLLASEQKTLIDSARQSFDDASAANLVRQALPFLLVSPLEQLADDVAGYSAPAADDSAADSGEAADDVAAGASSPAPVVADDVGSAEQDESAQYLPPLA